MSDEPQAGPPAGSFYTPPFRYEAIRMPLKFWRWQVLAISKIVITSSGKPLTTHTEYENLSKDAAIGYAKLLNEAGEMK